MSDYEADQAAAEEALRPRLTDEFLSTLVQAVRTVGHGVDHVESIALVQEVFAIAGKKSPAVDDMKPFADDMRATEFQEWTESFWRDRNRPGEIEAWRAAIRGEAH